jgi:hypothetical protein
MDNFSDLKQLERHIANDVTPSMSTTDILANLKLLSETSKLTVRPIHWELLLPKKLSI